MSLAGDGLAEGGDDDDHELDTVHPLTTDDIRKPTEKQLPDKSTNGGSDLDAEILVDVQLLTLAVDIAKHGRRDVDRKNIVAVQGACQDASDTTGDGGETHASVKKPTPATMQTLKWKKLRRWGA